MLNGLFKLIKGYFHSLGSALSDLKGGRGFIFCDFRLALISAVLSVDSPQLQGGRFDRNHGSGPHGALNAPISSSVSRHPVPRGAEDCESGCGFSSLVMPDLCAFNFGDKTGVEE